MPPCFDFYALTADRDGPAIENFVADHVRDHETIGHGHLDSWLRPLSFHGHENELALGDWDFVTFDDLEHAVRLGRSTPRRAFRLYLNAVPPWLGALLCFTTTGEVVFGLGRDMTVESSDDRAECCELLVELGTSVAATRGWAVNDEPPPLDPWCDRPWEQAEVVAVFDGTRSWPSIHCTSPPRFDGLIAGPDPAVRPLRGHPRERR